MEDSFHNDSQENLKNKSRMEITILDPFRQVMFFFMGVKYTVNCEEKIDTELGLLFVLY